MNLTADYFHDADKAREYLEAQRWPHGPVCPHCGAPEAEITKLVGKAHRPGVFQCNQCREQFTVTVGTVMERSKIPLHKWLLAIHLLGSSKKGMSAHQLHRTLEITYQSAWFLCHRIREAMRDDAPTTMGGPGKIMEADETYFGKSKKPHVSAKRAREKRPFTKRGKFKNNRPIVALVERGGSVRTFHVPVADKFTVTRIVRENIARESRLHTDESKLYTGSDQHFAAHETVTHSARNTLARTSTPIQLKAISQSSSAGCAASISIAARNTCTATSLSLIFATTIALGSVWMTPSGPLASSRAQMASG
jgi:transposase-like protein